MIRVVRKSAVIEESVALALRPETFDAARALVPGADVYALEAEWRAFAQESPRPLRDPDAAFLGWVKARAG